MMKTLAARLRQRRVRLLTMDSGIPPLGRTNRKRLRRARAGEMLPPTLWKLRIGVGNLVEERQRMQAMGAQQTMAQALGMPGGLRTDPGAEGTRYRSPVLSSCHRRPPPVAAVVVVDLSSPVVVLSHPAAGIADLGLGSSSSSGRGCARRRVVVVVVVGSCARRRRLAVFRWRGTPGAKHPGTSDSCSEHQNNVNQTSALAAAASAGPGTATDRVSYRLPRLRSTSRPSFPHSYERVGLGAAVSSKSRLLHSRAAPMRIGTPGPLCAKSRGDNAFSIWIHIVTSFGTDAAVQSLPSAPLPACLLASSFWRISFPVSPATLQWSLNTAAPPLAGPRAFSISAFLALRACSPTLA